MTPTLGQELSSAQRSLDGHQTTSQLRWQEAPQWQSELQSPVANQYVLGDAEMAARYDRFLQASSQSVKSQEIARVPVPAPKRWRSFAPTPQRHQRTPPQVRNSTVSGSQFHMMAKQHLHQSVERFGRGMPLSAREHAEQALHQFSLATDAQVGSNLGSKSLSAGMEAIREAGDFLGRFGNVDPNSIQRLVDSHQTPVLRNCDLSTTSTFQAADAYFEYARIQLGRMDRQWPEASVALEMLARTEAIANRQSKEITMASRTCLLRAAVDCNPDNADALLALGTILTRTGVYQEATTALELCYAINQSPEALRMLSSLHQKAGNQQLAQLCQAKLRSANSEYQASSQGLSLATGRVLQDVTSSHRRTCRPYCLSVKPSNAHTAADQPTATCCDS